MSGKGKRKASEVRSTDELDEERVVKRARSPPPTFTHLVTVINIQGSDLT